MVDNLGQGTNRGFVGKRGLDGVDLGHWSGVGRWLIGWVGYRGGFPIKKQYEKSNLKSKLKCYFENIKSIFISIQN